MPFREVKAGEASLVSRVPSRSRGTSHETKLVLGGLRIFCRRLIELSRSSERNTQAFP